MSKTGVYDSTNLSHWLTKQEVARELNLSEKSVDRLAERGVLQKQRRKQRGSPALAVFHPDEVAKLKLEREAIPPPPFPMPPAATNGTAIAATKQPAGQPEAAALVQVLQVIADHITGPDLKEPHFLTLKQARDISGLPVSFLHSRFVAAGLAVRTGAGWRIARTELERFARESMRTGVDTSKTEPSRTGVDTSSTAQNGNHS